MDKQGQFSLNKTEILGAAPEGPWAAIGYSIAANQLSKIIEVAAKDIAETGRLAPGFENAVIRAFDFYKDPAFASLSDNEEVMAPMVAAAQRFEKAMTPYISALQLKAS